MTGEIEVRAPFDQTEGTRSHVLQWLKAVGDAVSESEPLLEIETDKVTVEVAAPGAGVLREILKAEQEEIAPGELLGWIALQDEDSLASIPHPAETPAVAAMASDAQRRDAAAHGDAEPQSAAPRRAAEPAQPPAGGRAQATRGAHAQPSPAVMRLLRERGLQPEDVQASSPDGRLTVKDVLAHRGERDVATAERGRPSDGANSLARGRSVPHTAVRKRIAQHMVQSLLQTAPHVTTVFEADMTNALAHRERLKAAFRQRGVALTLTAYFVQAAVAGLREVPEANSRWTESALQLFEAMHIGIATAVDAGLVVPVLHDAQSLDLFGIAAGLQELVSRARNGTLAPADVRGGTFTISNHGVSGSLLAAPIVINQPQSAILGVGKLEKRAVVVNRGPQDEVLVQPRCYVTLTIDHRVMDGHRANRFLQTFVQQLQAPTD